MPSAQDQVEGEVEDFFSKPSEKEKGVLQNKFKEFRDQKIKEALERKEKLAHSKKKPRTTEEMARLRGLWVEQLKKYIGVPYARKYVDDGVYGPAEEVIEEYAGFNNGALPAGQFLDCCGLLRQASMDLKEEFGWNLARWNQAYQFALCSEPIEESELQPGDLVFYEAIYLDEKKRAQHYNITHIEIFLGEEGGAPGAKGTIGSRWKQRVKLHETYELGTPALPSQLWEVKKFHFFSFDEWAAALRTPDFNPDLVEIFGVEKDPYRLFAVLDTKTMQMKKSAFYVGSPEDDDVDGAQGNESAD